MTPCECKEQHATARIVMTGGPGAGKTAVLELVRQSLCSHMRILPEAAGIVFGGGFPRGDEPELKRAGQRAIYYVQRELEETAKAFDAAIVLCDRGTVDGVAYWPGPEPLWDALGTSLDAQLKRYDAVVHMRTPLARDYNHANPLRVESVAQAQIIDERIALAWEQHSNRHFIEAAEDFVVKAARAVEVLRGLMPECCRKHVGPDSESA